MTGILVKLDRRRRRVKKSYRIEASISSARDIPLSGYSARLSTPIPQKGRSDLVTWMFV